MKVTDDILRRLGRLVVRENAPLGLVIDTRYEVQRRLARGGMGEIFRARDLRLNRPVAMKVLASSLADPEWAARFEDEARTMGRIEHPGVVPIHDLGLLPDGRLFYTMKLIDGNTLEELIQAGEGRPVLLDALARTCDIVHHAHQAGVIHRDLKPSNVMLGRDGQLYVLDWGIARVRQEIHAPEVKTAAGGEGYTSAGVVLGTLAYMPPEQARADAGEIDARSDVYALGAILYEVLTGVPPVQGESVAEMLEKATKGEIEAPRSLDPSLAPDLEAVCLKALNHSRRLRYASARELGVDLRRWLSGDPVRAYAGGARYLVSKIIRKRRWQVATAAVMLVGMAAFGGYWLTHRGDAAVAEAKRIEDEVFGPVRKRLDQLPQTRQGWTKGLQLLNDGLARHPGSWDGWMMKGELCNKLGQTRPALDAFGQASRLNPRLAVARYHRGRILMDHEKRFGEAREEFEAALRAEPTNEYALLGKARLSVLEGNHEQALALCANAEPLSPHLSEAPFIRAYVYATGPRGRIRDIDRAIEGFTRVIQLSPARAIAHTNRGVLYLEKGDVDAALKDHDQAVALNPDDSGFLSNRSHARIGKRDLDGAIADASKAIYLDPTKEAPYTNRGNARLLKGDVEGGLADSLKALELDPKSAPAYVNVGLARTSQARFEEALAAYTKAVEFDPFHSDALVNRGLLLKDKGDLEGALRDLSKALELKPRDSEAYNNRGLVHQARGDSEAARADFAKAIEVDPLNASAHSNRGIFRQRRGDLEGAAADLAKAVELDPRLPEIWTNLGVVRGERGDVDGAIEAHTKALELNARFAAAWGNRGGMRLRKGDQPGALSDLNRALEIDPNHAEALSERGLAKYNAKDYDGAIADITRALDLGLRNSNAWMHLGLARRDKGDARGSLGAFTRALEIDPRNAGAYVNRGVTLLNLGETVSGRSDLRKALELAPPDWPHRGAVEEVLRKLGSK